MMSVLGNCLDECPDLLEINPAESGSCLPSPEHAAVPQSAGLGGTAGAFLGFPIEILCTQGKTSVNITSIMQIYGSFNKPVLSTMIEYFITLYLLHACRSYPKP